MNVCVSDGVDDNEVLLHTAYRKQCTSFTLTTPPFFAELK